MISSQRHLRLFRAGCLSLGGDTPNTTRVLTQFGDRSIFQRLQPAAKPYLDALASVLVSLSIYVTRLLVGVRALSVCRLRHVLPAAPCMWQTCSGPAQIMVRPVSSGEPQREWPVTVHFGAARLRRRRHGSSAANRVGLKRAVLSDPEFVMIGPAKDAAQDKTKGSSPPEFTRKQEFAALRDMLLIRRFEEKAGQLYGMGAIGGFCHLYIGQEAVVVGMQMALKDGDQVITGYRDHGHMLACGMDAKGVVAELTGRRGGYSKGKGGSLHMFSTEKHFYGGHGIVGAQVSLGTGLAFANRYRGNDSVCLTYFGDGAANQGQVYESFNMAALWKLPVVYVIENNRYAMGTSVSRSSAQTDFSKRASPSTSRAGRSTAWTSAP